MKRTDVLQHIAALRNGDPMIISPGLAIRSPKRKMNPDDL